MNPDLTELFGAWAPLVRVENDASLAAVAEGSVGAAVGLRDFVTVLSGEFLGAGAVVDGNLLRGAHGGVAEMVAFDHVVGVEDAGGLGVRISRWAQEADPVRRDLAGRRARPTPGPPRPTAGRCSRSPGRATGTRSVLVARAGRVLSIIAGVFGSLFDPRRVILSGMAPADAADLVDAARASLSLELDLPAPELVASELGGDVVCIGAVSRGAGRRTRRRPRPRAAVARPRLDADERVACSEMTDAAPRRFVGTRHPHSRGDYRFASA